MTHNLRVNIVGTLTTILSALGGLTLEHVNAVLQTIALLIAIATGSITLFNIFRHKDTKSIKEGIEIIQTTLDNK